MHNIKVNNYSEAKVMTLMLKVIAIVKQYEIWALGLDINLIVLGLQITGSVQVHVVFAL